MFRFRQLRILQITERPKIEWDDKGTIAHVSLGTEGEAPIMLSIPATILAQWPADIERGLANRPQPNPDH